METHEQHDDPTDDDAVMAHRARAKVELDEIARQARQALTEQGLDTSLFFLVPNSGDSILTYGCHANPSDHEWRRVGEVVSAIVRKVVGLDRTRCQEVACATTDDLRQPVGADGAESR
jgi:hypothetical protein